MLAKVVAHGRDRDEAVAVLARALRGSAIHGVTTNLASLTAVLESTAFAVGDTPTDFLERHPGLLDPAVPDDLCRRSHLVAAALHAAQQRRATAAGSDLRTSGLAEREVGPAVDAIRGRRRGDGGRPMPVAAPQTADGRRVDRR